jgi:hypothetical protein
MWWASKFGSTCICLKCKFKAWVLSDWMIINFTHYIVKWIIVILYCTFVQRWSISSSTMGSTWFFLLDNGDNKYKCFFEQILDNVVYIKPSFVTPIGSNAKQLKVRHYAQYFVHVIASCTGNWFL